MGDSKQNRPKAKILSKSKLLCIHFRSKEVGNKNEIFKRIHRFPYPCFP